jgi:hypothetical protein
MNKAQAEVDKLIRELHLIQYRDLKTASSLKQKSFILARKLLGENCPHSIALNKLTFVPSDGIYNDGHPQNKYAWESGIGSLRNSLEGMQFELGLVVPKLLPPQEMTFGWLVDHVPAKGWVTLCALLGMAFSAGVWLEKHFKIAS